MVPIENPFNLGIAFEHRRDSKKSTIHLVILLCVLELLVQKFPKVSKSWTQSERSMTSDKISREKNIIEANSCCSKYAENKPGPAQVGAISKDQK